MGVSEEGVARVWPGCGPGAARVWPGWGQGLDRVWTGCDQGGTGVAAILWCA